MRRHKMIKPWPCIRSQLSNSFRVFSIRTDTVISPRTGAEHDFYIIESGDWINVIPLTPGGQVIMIRQYRHGARKITLEIPGGLIDPGDTPEKAAARELLEETGYEAEGLVQIGVVNPNPALFNNRCYTYVARNVQKTHDATPDQAEDIEVVLIPLPDIPKLIQNGDIDHAMVITAFYWYFSQDQQGLKIP